MNDQGRHSTLSGSHKFPLIIFRGSDLAFHPLSIGLEPSVTFQFARGIAETIRLASRNTRHEALELMSAVKDKVAMPAVPQSYNLFRPKGIPWAIGLPLGDTLAPARRASINGSLLH